MSLSHSLSLSLSLSLSPPPSYMLSTRLTRLADWAGASSNDYGPVCRVPFCRVPICPSPSLPTLSACQFHEWQSGGGVVAQLIERRTGTLPTQIRFPGAARDFSPGVNFRCRFSYGLRTSPCAIACIYICAHVKDPVVHVRVRWIMETLKHPACTVRWVARLCRRWLSPGKATGIFHGKSSIWTIQF